MSVGSQNIAHFLSAVKNNSNLRTALQNASGRPQFVSMALTWSSNNNKPFTGAELNEALDGNGAGELEWPGLSSFDIDPTLAACGGGTICIVTKWTGADSPCDPGSVAVVTGYTGSGGPAPFIPSNL